MGSYEGWVLPRLVNLLMGNAFITGERKKALVGFLTRGIASYTP
ncbi:MAG TPA: hypothetical protein VHC69_18795 [Polyangiaceae bacterium]|nr:hypothetical protein [Polyangiaceae bacterium]